jgi:hypothetical protein
MFHPYDSFPSSDHDGEKMNAGLYYEYVYLKCVNKGGEVAPPPYVSGKRGKIQEIGGGGE